MAVLFLFAGARESVAHSWCPHHDGPQASHPEQAADEHAHHSGDQQDTPAHSGDHEGCTCLGTCQPGSYAPLLGSEPEYTLASAFWTHTVVHVPALTGLPGRVPHTLPYAQAPPAHS
jgi:hypothetical protein